MHRFLVIDYHPSLRNIYIMMELCAAGDLSAYVRRHRRLPESTCKFFLRQLAIALRYMRTHNVSHFDLKPQNLLLTHTPALTLKVGDFGFAQHLGLADTNTQLKGSPLYMAPEILLSRRYDPSADLWSIGCILYECLFGAAPYRSRSLDELLQKVRQQQRIELPAGQLSVACEDLLARLLVHNPAERIGFEAFFAHEFLDVEHEPTEENLSRAVTLITRAVAEDTAGHWEAAYATYCEGLQFFVPLIAAEANAQKRAQLRRNADAYLRRAEEIRSCCVSNGAVSSPAALADSVAAQSDAVERALRPSAAFAALRTASASSPALRDGLDMGRQAELYMIERNYAAAIAEYRRALSVLVPALSGEPRGERRERLHRQVSGWMHEAEQVKVLMATRDQLRTEAEADAVAGQVKSSAVDVTQGEDDGATRTVGAVASSLAYAKSCCLQ